jgi:hypothetical protein
VSKLFANTEEYLLLRQNICFYDKIFANTTKYMGKTIIEIVVFSSFCNMRI